MRLHRPDRVQHIARPAGLAPGWVRNSRVFRTRRRARSAQALFRRPARLRGSRRRVRRVTPEAAPGVVPDERAYRLRGCLSSRIPRIFRLYMDERRNPLAFRIRGSDVFGSALRAEGSPSLYRLRSAWFACTVRKLLGPNSLLNTQTASCSSDLASSPRCCCSRAPASDA